ncbi:hypothetical protein [Mesonia aestuariivivens]|uniref:Membrane or secreted protein n=1 Tax=Mesonia aestuariivivens TaxID=2796128 RepID=A0ABS6W3J2_9FLAO|nr:hypothetical protein [Mesonia aestuariivivens]MBW2962437.1 hypothetical protein [Mesonia aestuariivivens]
MKKFLVLGVLFILPIVAYLFFASGVNNFAKLPVLTPAISDVTNFKSLSEENVSLEGKITVLSIYGDNVEGREGNAFNLNEKIYDKNYNFKDFQLVVIAQDGQQEQVKSLLNELSSTIDIKKWKFVFGSKEEIIKFYKSLDTNLKLDKHLSTSHAFIIDKNKSLRGRQENNNEEVRYGYDTSSVADLTNAMVDDVKVILAEYRLALKKYNKKEGLK